MSAIDEMFDTGYWMVAEKKRFLELITPYRPA
jgi:hypothetical protein